MLDKLEEENYIIGIYNGIPIYRSDVLVDSTVLSSNRIFYTFRKPINLKNGDTFTINFEMLMKWKCVDLIAVLKL